MSAQPGRVPEWTLGDRLRKARLDAGYRDVQAFADLIGVSRNSVPNWESDRHRPREIALRAWALATGVDRDWIEFGIIPTDDGGGVRSTPNVRTGSGPTPIPSRIPMLTLARAA